MFSALTPWRKKFAAAWRGWGWVLRGSSGWERSWFVHLPAAVVVLIGGVVQGVGGREMALLILAISGVIVAEIFNTCLERLCRVVSPEAHPEIGQVLDMAAGAVLFASLAAVAVGIAVFGPRWW